MVEEETAGVMVAGEKAGGTGAGEMAKEETAGLEVVRGVEEMEVAAEGWAVMVVVVKVVVAGKAVAAMVVATVDHLEVVAMVVVPSGVRTALRGEVKEVVVTEVATGGGKVVAVMVEAARVVEARGEGAMVAARAVEEVAVGTAVGARAAATVVVAKEVVERVAAKGGRWWRWWW